MASVVGTARVASAGARPTRMMDGLVGLRVWRVRGLRRRVGETLSVVLGCGR